MMPFAKVDTIRDHPRVCGEKIAREWLAKIKVGSPPRMRGKGYAGDEGDGRGGITPAYAGKRTSRI